MRINKVESGEEEGKQHFASKMSVRFNKFKIEAVIVERAAAVQRSDGLSRRSLMKLAI